MPGRAALVHRQIPAHHPAQFSAKVLRRDTATLQIAKDAFLFEGIQTLAGILQADGFKAPHSLLIIQGEHHTAQVERNILDHHSFVMFPLQNYKTFFDYMAE
jgi:hypothetical protein